MTWAEMPDGKRLPFDELGQFLLTIRNQGHEEDEYIQAIPIARRHACTASEGGSRGAPDRGPEPDEIL
jgi:hypothetical protein